MPKRKQILPGAAGNLRKQSLSFMGTANSGKKFPRGKKRLGAGARMDYNRLRNPCVRLRPEGEEKAGAPQPPPQAEGL